MTLADLTASFEARAKEMPGGVLYLTAKQVNYAMFLAHKAGLPSLPLNRGYTPLPGPGNRWSFKAPEG